MKYHNFYLIIGFLFTFTVSCYQKITPVEIIKVKESSRQISIGIDSFSLDITHKNYKQYSHYSEGDTSYMIVNNLRQKEFQVFNITHNKLIRQIPYDICQTGAEFIGICYHNHDSIFIVEFQNIVLIDRQNNTKNFPINSNIDKSGFFLSGYTESPPFFDEIDNSILLHAYPKRYKNARMEVAIPLDKNRRVKVFPLEYPQKMQDNSFGFLNKVNRAVNDSLSILSLDADENIYVLNRRTGNSRVVGGKSSYQELKIIPIDRDVEKDAQKKLLHFSLSPSYPWIRYDPYEKLYFRYFWKGLPEKNIDGFFNSSQDRKTHILMIFDENFNLITEKEIEHSLRRAFVTAEGIVVPVLSDKEEVLNFKIYKIR